MCDKKKNKDTKSTTKPEPVGKPQNINTTIKGIFELNRNNKKDSNF